ncbi:MAG: hypothetical protein HY360_09430, partial [Verrucomicrobia bacterium]|nr:hypothetical protein [Verrucomicrobiota bacterium]
MSTGWSDVTEKAPCPICKHPDWCSRSQDGRMIVCRRIDNGMGIHKVDRSGGDFWLYRLDGISMPSTTQVVDLPPEAPRAAPEILDRVYRSLLNLLTLEKHHYENLWARGFPPDTNFAFHLLYRSLPLKNRYALASEVLREFGEEIVRLVPGFFQKQKNGNKWWSLSGIPGLFIPVRDLRGWIVGLKIRADDPQVPNRYFYLSSRKHDGPGPGAQLHVPLHTSSSDIVRITEGEIKADLASLRTKLLTVSIPGVSI